MSKELYRTEDKYGPVIVLERGDKRVLSFGSDFQQTCVDTVKPWYLVHEYTQIMLLGLVFGKAKNIVLLGLGGGGLVHCLNYFYPQMKLDVVEIRQAVIDVAYEWFDLPRTKNINLHCEDANDYIKQAKACHADIIFSDLYEAYGMSDVQVQAEFISSCVQALNETGWLIINFHSLPDKKSAMMKQLSDNFSDIFYCDIFKGNWVVFCGKTHSCFNAQEISGRVVDLGNYINAPMKYFFKKIKKL